MQTCGKIIWILKKSPDTLVYSKGMAILTNARYISRGQSRTIRREKASATESKPPPASAEGKGERVG